MTGPQININHRQLILSGFSRRLITVLNKVSSYKVAGYYWSPAFKNGWWDGTEKLLKLNKRTQQYTAPVGLYDDFILALGRRGVTPIVVDERPEPERVEYNWDGTQLRKYQLKAIHRVVNHPGPMRGSGIINMPIRSGKTKTAAGLITQMKVRTLFIVPSGTLMTQARDALGESLQTEIGQLGGGVYDLKDVTVATVQTLLMLNNITVTKASKEAKERWDKTAERLAKKGEEPELTKAQYAKAAREQAKEQMALWARIKTHFGLVIMDECHHLTADGWSKAVWAIEAKYRVGLSATAFPDLAKEQEKGVIWLKALCGPIRIRVSTDKLINAGYLTPARVVIQDILRPNRLKAGWSQRLRNECVLLNPHRNAVIIAYAARYAAEGMRVLIVSNRLAQVSALVEAAASAALPCDDITGRHSEDERSAKVMNLIQRKPAVLIGTVLSEGADIPEVEVVINAEGGRDMKTTIQRMRNLTVSEGKTEAVFVDFMDLTNEYFRKHSKARLRVYQEFSGFTIERIKGRAAA